MQGGAGTTRSEVARRALAGSLLANLVAVALAVAGLDVPVVADWLGARSLSIVGWAALGYPLLVVGPGAALLTIFGPDPDAPAPT